jgi:TonB family protein
MMGPLAIGGHGPRTLGLLCLVLVVATAWAQNDEFPLPYVHKEPAFDIGPQYPGGSVAMMRYFADSVRYPEPERTQRKQGQVLVAFTVTKKGKVTGVRVVNGVAGAPDLAREAERLLAAMPRWAPATKKGRRVDAELSLSIPFRVPKSRELIHP